ncbi:DUF4097 family beta strand repeat-containing protein [Thermodesulfobacteriota bacterium]
MKKYYIIKVLLIFLILSPTISFSKDKNYDSVVEFGDPNAEKIIQFTGNGDLNVTGYNGNKVVISTDKKIFKDDKVSEKAKGLKKIGGGGFNIINNKKNNIVIISRPIDEEIDLDVKVPNNSILKFGSDINKDTYGNSGFMNKLLTGIVKPVKPGKPNQNGFVTGIIGRTLSGVFYGIMEGEINIKNFAGSIEVNTVDGDINAENIEGEVIASTVDGDITVTFKKLNKDGALYFSSVDGDIDITLPKGTKADIMARTMEGDVYSGFEGDVTMGREVEDETATTEHKTNFLNIFQSNYITTRINGGGHDVYLNTIDGDIYIRKGN